MQNYYFILLELAIRNGSHGATVETVGRVMFSLETVEEIFHYIFHIVETANIP